MPSGRKTPIRDRVVDVDEDGYAVTVKFNPLEWPFCVDYKFRDEAHSDRYSDCMALAMEDDWKVWRDVLSRPDSYPLLVQVIAKTALSLTMKPAYMRSYEAELANLMTRMLAFSLEMFPASKLESMAGGGPAWHETYRALRRTDPRWGLVKITLFDIVEEGFLYETGMIFRQIMERDATADRFHLRIPYWAMEYDNQDYLNLWVTGREERVARNDWGVAVADEDWTWW